MDLLNRIDRQIARLEGFVIVGMLGVMVLLTFLLVALRGLYAYAEIRWANTLLGILDGSGPFVNLLLLWLSFLGASLLTRDGKHIQIDLLSGLLPGRWRQVREFLVALCSLMISGVMLKVCLDHVRMEMTFGGTTAFHIPLWLGEIILPAGFALISFRFLLRAIREGVRLLKGDPCS